MASARSAIVYDLGRDVRAVQEMASRLTPYVYEEELYGLVPGDLPKLTIGGLLMRLHRLSAIADQLAPGQQETLKMAQTKLDEVRRDWPVALEGKVQREFPVRITAIAQFVGECADNPKTCKDDYPNAVEKRVMLQALYDEAAAHGYLTEEMKGSLLTLDNKLHRYVEAGDFIWDKRLQRAYSQDKYWFLYAG